MESILVGNRQRFVVAAEVVEIVGEVNRRVAILRQLLQHLVAELGRLVVIAFVQQVALALPHDARIVVHLAVGALNPLAGQLDLLRFDRGIGSVGDDDRILRRKLVRLLIIRVGAVELLGLRVQVAQRQIRDVVVGISLASRLKYSAAIFALLSSRYR